MRTLLMSGLCFLIATSAAPLSAASTASLPYGLTRNGVPLTITANPAFFDVTRPVTRILLVAAPGPDAAAQARTETLLRAFIETLAVDDARFPGSAAGVIAAPYPAGPYAPAYPPAGRAYDDPDAPEPVFLWRRIGLLAPDLVVEVRAAEHTAWQAAPGNDRLSGLATLLGAEKTATPDGLVAALSAHSPCDVGPVPALALQAAGSTPITDLRTVLETHPVRSRAGEVMRERLERTPLAIATALAGVYGQQFTEVAYIPALPLIGRLRLGELTGDPSHLAAVTALAAPYRTGARPSLPARSNGSQQAGHLLFGALADTTGDPGYTDLLLRAARLAFDAEGKPLPAMPAHAEMSDAVFLGTPLLAQAARLSGEPRYRDAALRHLQFMLDLNRRPDGLHRHSPVAPEQTAWGRGNGFVALGLALTLSEWPEDDPAFAGILASFRDHVEAMRRHQDPLGLWHQVVDEPASYTEYTVTAMTTFAMARGLRRGWLDRSVYEPVVRRAWPALAQRTGADGGLVDVCTGTGKMRSQQEYLDRPALLGRDERGGGLALMLFTELAFAQREGVLVLP